MNGVLTNTLIAVGITSAVGYALVSHLQSRSGRSRAGRRGSGSDNDLSPSDSSWSGGWFASDGSNSAADGSSCASGDSGGGGDCGGGGD